MKVAFRKVVIFILVLFFFTFLRGTLLMLIPLLPALLYIIFPFRLKKQIIPIFLLSLISSGYGVLFGYNNFENVIFSIILLFSVLMIAFSSPVNLGTKPIIKDWNNLLSYTLKVVFVFMFINNSLGIIQYFLNPFNHYPQEDAFIGIYGRHGIAHHGLAILNGYFVLFYVSQLVSAEKRQAKKAKNIILLLYFSLSHFLCFYGLGLIILLLSIVIYTLIKSLSVKLFFKLAFIGTGIIFIFSYFFSDVYSYMTENINYLTVLFSDFDYDSVYIPGKIRAWIRYFTDFVGEELGLVLFGTGPGGFNSRVSFLLNSDSSNLFVKIFGTSMPAFHDTLIHPLWDMSIISMDKYNDGSRNQPFSSLLSLTSEYGIIFTITLFVMLKKEINRVSELIEDNRLKGFIILSVIYIFLNVIFDNFIEFSEFWVFIVFLFFLKIHTIVRESESSIRS
ncbi:hypothetical protein [Marinilabilia rubra]|uniref:Oligosaccharide repeat unit polymerase n=1 Tax=Marinilabilia rubra TaxID=2162893 RepID=A0A2U2B3Q0_9BACT|nr:hypothetical protein [Marinilabilia rubra]PWD97688.1 hypothetical protein DDZ16_19550 [Marinilabilia rubra]